MSTAAPKRNANGRRSSRITLKEVAEASGVSIMTVSNVIHDRPNVSSALRDLVQKKIAELGYVPNRAAQELAGVSRPHFGLLYTSVINPFIASVIVGSMNAASRLGVDISVQLASLNEQKTLRETLHRMEDDGIEGFLLPSPIAELAARAFKRKPLPVPAVAIAPGLPLAGMAAVRSDERQASVELVSALLDLGHIRIGHIAGPDTQSGSAARYEGYCAALRARGVEPRPEYVVKSPFFRFQEGVKAAELLLDQAPRVTAVFAANDTLAASVLTVAHRRGITVPEALSVVGYDDAPVAEQIWPGLTTVHQDAKSITERAVELLHAQVRAARAGTPASIEDVVLPYSLIHRASTAPAPADV